jgi:hypothetical protein
MAAASAVTGVMGAVGGVMDSNNAYNAQVAQTQAANNHAIANYHHQINIKRQQWNRQVMKYNFQKQTYESQRQWNALASGRAYNSELRKLDDTFKQAAFQDQAGFTKLMEMQGAIEAKGDRSGKSVDDLQQAVLGSFGKNQAIQSQQLTDATYQTGHNMIDTWYENYNKDVNAWAEVAIPPSYGMDPMPPMMRGYGAPPSGLSAAASIGGAAIQGIGGFL